MKKLDGVYMVIEITIEKADKIPVSMLGSKDGGFHIFLAANETEIKFINKLLNEDFNIMTVNFDYFKLVIVDKVQLLIELNLELISTLRASCTTNNNDNEHDFFDNVDHERINEVEKQLRALLLVSKQ